MGVEMGSILWPQSLGVARLLPAGKREFGEISAADVPDNTVERQLNRACACLTGMCSPPPASQQPRGADLGPLEFARTQGPRVREYNT